MSRGDERNYSTIFIDLILLLKLLYLYVHVATTTTTIKDNAFELRRALLLLLPFSHRFLCFCSRPFHSPAHRLSFARLSHSFFSSLQSFQFRSREPFRPFFIQFKLPKLDRLFSFVRFVRVVVVVVGVEAHDERVIVVVGISSSSSSSSSPSHGRRPGHERFPSRNCVPPPRRL